ncbi:unnamed protein product [Pseudo-nitzschia multistriata]|uniref:Uncharacterized protein n=1 Tax=Pseudo-nitzschia multistriata TaxID=183589 RepID=A0A448ZDC6_9STRA|nr:unnamed protein product [Pseudo-nitzschia multistriata]
MRQYSIHTSLQIFNQDRPRFSIVGRIDVKDKRNHVRSSLVDVDVQSRCVAIQPKAISNDWCQFKARPCLGIMLQLFEDPLGQILTVDEPRAGLGNRVNFSLEAGPFLHALPNRLPKILHQSIGCPCKSKAVLRKIFLEETGTDCLRESLESVRPVLNFADLAQPVLEQLSPSGRVGNEFFRGPRMVSRVVKLNSLFLGTSAHRRNEEGAQKSHSQEE